MAEESTNPDDLYVLVRFPKRLAPHNAKSWEKIERLFEFRTYAHFTDLTTAVEGHMHYGTNPGNPEGFIRHCIKNGWIALK